MSGVSGPTAGVSGQGVTDDDHKSKNERKKNHAAQGRKGAPGSKRDDQLPKIVKKV